MHDAQSLHMNLLQALLCAGMHSRAAYGYAMAAGHLSSLLNFALLQTVRNPPPHCCLSSISSSQYRYLMNIRGVRTYWVAW